MDANQACDVLPSYLKESNLNWNLIESPFSLTINLKKSFIKDKEGNPRTCKFAKLEQNDRELKSAVDENKSLNKALVKTTHEKEEVMKVLKNKAEEIENLHANNLEISSELSKISEELYNTKLELSKCHFESETSASEVDRLENVVANQN